MGLDARVLVHFKLSAGCMYHVTVYTTSADDGPGGAFPGALPRWRRLARRVRVLHGNQPHFMTRLRARDLGGELDDSALELGTG